jgi:endonuclease VIII
MPEGDTIAFAARRLRPVLEGHVPDEIRTPQRRHAMDRWPERLGGRAITEITTHGKHLFVHFEGGLLLHSHLRMTGAWGVYPPGRRPRRSMRRAWLVLRRDTTEAVQFDGPVLELLTESRARLDPYLAGLGPDVLAEEFDYGRFLARLRGEDPTRGIGDALLDQRTIAGIGNIWKSEACFDAGVDPWRPTSEVSDDEAHAIVDAARPRMRRSAETGDQTAERHVFRRPGEPCPRCGTAIRARGQGDANRTTFWCPGCQH